jgi:hypothetical protein
MKVDIVYILTSEVKVLGLKNLKKIKNMSLYDYAWNQHYSSL